MLQQNTYYESIFEGDEIKILENVINKMNQNTEKSLVIIWFDRNMNMNMKSTSNLTNTLSIDIDGMKIVSMLEYFKVRFGKIL